MFAEWRLVYGIWLHKLTNTYHHVAELHSKLLDVGEIVLGDVISVPSIIELGGFNKIIVFTSEDGRFKLKYKYIVMQIYIFHF